MTTEQKIPTPMTTEQLNHPARMWFINSYLRQPGMTKKKAAEELGLSHRTLNAIENGIKHGDVDSQLNTLAEQQKRLAGVVRVEGVDLDHIPTAMARRIWAAADAAKSAHLCVTVCGKSQIGKTTAVEKYKLMYPETTIFFRMPTRPTITTLVRELTEAAGLPKARNAWEGMTRLRAHLSPRHLIVADEVHLALTRRQGVDALDVLRELFDRCKCGLLLIVTDIGAREMTKGPFAERLAQLERRGEWEILPETPTNKDVRAVWEAYGLPEPDAETQQQIGAMARSSCFGQYVHRLKLAASFAQQEGRTLTWPDFIRAATRMARRPA